MDEGLAEQELERRKCTSLWFEVKQEARKQIKLHLNLLPVADFGGTDETFLLPFYVQRRKIFISSFGKTVKKNLEANSSRVGVL